MAADKIILITDPEAARPHTVTGWLSGHGRFYLEERVARYDGCTHVPCSQCGKPAPKGYLKCDDCRDEDDLKAFAAMPEQAWDGKCMVYSHAKDKYYGDPGDAEDDLEEGETPADLRLVLCAPICARPLDADYFVDDLPEDGELPNVCEDAIEAFNKAVAGKILSWSPSKVRLKLEA